MLKTHWCLDYRPKRLSPLFRSVLIFLSAWLLISPFPSPSVQAAQVRLAWDPSPGPDAEGYKVYYGTASRSYSYTVDVGPSTACVVAGLQDGMPYYFATTAYNGSLQESVFSNEVSYAAGPAPDTTPPTVSSTSPANSVTGVPINTAINATFTEAMDPASITTATFTLWAGSTSIGGTVSYSGTTATFTPSSSLAYNTTYTAMITTGVRDLAGNAMQASYSWSFTTGLAPDVTPPTVSSTDPAHLAMGVAVNKATCATFTEAMDPASITTATFTLWAGSTSIGGTVSYSGTTATFTPSSSLAYNTYYTATITTGVRDLAGNTMQSACSWSFATGSAPDVTPPTVSSTDPGNLRMGVAVNTAICATFSKAMDPATLTTATFNLWAGSTSIGGTVSYSGTTATFTPSSSLAYDTTYTATITTGVRDLAGNAMQASYSWSFTTGLAPDIMPPTVLSTDPRNGVIWVSVSTAIRATFTEAMDPASITTATFALKTGSTSIGGTVSYRRTRATFTPSSSLAYDTTYTATITTGVRDLAGNAMQASYSWSFTTGSHSRHRR